jgi:type I restriction enzyme S subunit
MKGWVTKRLEEVADSDCSLSYGIVQPGEEFVDGLPVVRPTDLTMKVIELSELKRIDPTLAAGYQRTTLQGGELLLCVRGSTGTISVASSELSGANVTRGIVPIRFKKTLVDSNFGYYLMIADQVQRQIREKTYGAALMQINIRDLRNIEISFPPLAEQQRIVGLLDEAFEGLATARANAEKNLQNARALFESHLQAVFTQRGPGWVETTLDEVLTVQPQNGWSPPAAHHAAAGTPVLTLSSVTGFVFRPNKLKYTSAKTDPKARYWIQNGDFLITRSNTPELVGHVAIVSGIERPTIYPDLIMRMIPDPAKALTEFLYYQLRTPALRKEITGRAQGANPTMKKISNGAVKSLPIVVPPISTQKAIVTQLDALSAETQRLTSLYERKLAALAALKKALLHQAFAGEL